MDLDALLDSLLDIIIEGNLDGRRNAVPECVFKSAESDGFEMGVFFNKISF